MALSSPGVEVKVIDESFYTPAEPGTVPMIFVASAENKTNGSGTGIASGTLKANAGKPYLLTSQRELAETFGDPIFYTDSNNNPIHAGELNEYGLQAAYSILGISNRAYVVRADLDLGKLNPQADAPADNPQAGTYWLDTRSTAFGVQEWNGAAVADGGQTFTTKFPLVLTADSQVAAAQPKSSVGVKGDYAIVATDDDNKLWYKNASGAWVAVGSSAWKASHATAKSTTAVTSVTGTFDINGVPVTATTTINDLAADINLNGPVGVSAAVVGGSTLEIYSTGANLVIDNETSGLATTLGLLNAATGVTTKTFYAPALQISRHTSVPAWKTRDTASRPTGSVWVKTTEPNGGARWRIKLWNENTLLWEEQAVSIFASNEDAIYNLDQAGGGANLAVGELYVRSNAEEQTDTEATFRIYRRESTGATTVVGANVVADTALATGAKSFKIAETRAGQVGLIGNAALAQDYYDVDFTVATATSDANEELIANAVNTSGLEKVVAEIDGNGRLVLKHIDGGEFRIVDTDGILGTLGFSTSTTANLYAVPAGDATFDFVASNWDVLAVEAAADAPTSLTADGELWYSSVVDEVDIIIKGDNGWVGYRNFVAGTVDYADTDPLGPIVSASEPVTQQGGDPLAEGDLWINTSDLENYPQIYRYNDDAKKFELIDKSDQSTENGIIFADARWSINGGDKTSSVYDQAAIADLLVSDFVDFDAPDPALYPKGMMLFNLRRSGFNVKRFVRNYVDQTADNGRFGDEAMTNYFAHRWVTESGNQEDGSGSFGRKAQRKVVVQALQAMVNSNDDIRDDETRIFNLMACPGYPELIGEMISLNYDRNLSAFIIGDTPARLTPDATSLNEWGNNVMLAVEDNDEGLVSFDEYMGVYYPWGFTSDNAGNNVVVPPSHMMLRTMALSDQVAYPWFAPAGTRRGGITNATATGYVNSEGEFVSVALNEGQRDTLYGIAVNPITFLTGSGLVAFGQKTRARNASALDRVNVARLTIYMRSQLKKLAKPYLFEPNDKITRDEIKNAAESLCLELVGLRALYDYLVVCDESNNTPARIDRNELYLDIAIEPVKAVEFIYIPLRLKNTGEIAGL